MLVPSCSCTCGRSLIGFVFCYADWFAHMLKLLVDHESQQRSVYLSVIVLNIKHVSTFKNVASPLNMLVGQHIEHKNNGK